MPLNVLVVQVSPIEDREEIPMELREWSKTNAEYGRQLLHSGIEGARSGQEVFLNGRSLSPYLSESVRSAWKPALAGACLGVVSSRASYRERSIIRTLVFGVLGGVIGLGAGLAWESRRLTASVAGGALKSIGKARDEHWLIKHPIDYA